MQGIVPVHRAVNVAGLDPLRYTSAAAEGNAAPVALKASAGRFYRGEVEIITATQYWLMLFDQTASPTNGNTPIYRKRLTANGNTPINLFTDVGLYFAVKMWAAISSTSGTLTYAVANDMLLFAHYL